MALYSNPASTSTAPTSYSTEFDILKASHRFLRDEGSEDTRNASWDEQLAQKYYSSLFREFAVCDLKHYKSGNFALRWRTEAEVLTGAGETTCSNTRCRHHAASDDPDAPSAVPLKTLELPFAYEEHGEAKHALVKVVLCDSCVKKLMYKRNKEKERLSRSAGRESKDGHISQTSPEEDADSDRRSKEQEKRSRSRRRDKESKDRAEGSRDASRRRSRSRSPRRSSYAEGPHRRRRRSRSPRPS